ncbi:MAG: hypothetical protein R6V56_00160 [Lentisphaeria bacterium]
MNTKDIFLLRRFSRLTFLELAAFLLETGILFYFIFTHTLFWVSLVLLTKDVIAMALSVRYTKSTAREGGMLTAFQNLPKWLHVADRISAGLSAVGFLYLFLALNNIFVPGASG